ncbi:MAG: adenosylcobinamide-GDP ribazoletransferase [Deltaproteobacteria bacterium]
MNITLWRSVGIAFTFLTPFRVRTLAQAGLYDVARSAWAFPLVGAAIGLGLVLAHLVLAGLLPPFLAAVLVVGLWVAFTGGLHLDGWADCWDALPAAVPPERRLEILKDSRIGTYGVVGLVLLLAVKAAAIASRDLPLTALFLAPIVGRAAMVICAHGAFHRGEGMAAQFISGLDKRTVTWAAVLGLCPALIAGLTGIVAVVAACLGGFWFIRFAESKLNAINGDVIGAVCELSEALVLVVACVTW